MSSALLLYGATKKKPGFVLPWLVLKWIELVVLAIAIPVFIGFAISIASTDDDGISWPEVTESVLRILIGCAVWCGIWLGKMSNYKYVI